LLGIDSARIAEELGVNIRMIQRYLKKYNESGIDVILSDRRPGNHPKLSQEDLENIKRDITQGPKSGGYVVEGWTATLLAKHIYKKYKVVLNRESCRKILRDNSRIKKHYGTQRSGFNAKIVALVKEGVDVWLVGDVFLGYEGLAKNKQGKIPCLPGDELMSAEEIEDKKIDLTREPKKIILTIAKNLRTKEVIHQYDSSVQDKVTVRQQFLKVVVKRSQSKKIVLVLKKSNINTRVSTSVTHNKTARTITIIFRPPIDNLYDLDELKKELVKRFKLSGQIKGRRILHKRTLTAISDYLNLLRSNS